MSAEGDAPTRLVAGIDEAGLGPLLGPLTIGYAVMRVPREVRSIWSALDEVVGEEPSADRDRLVVADSKRVYSRNPRGRERLESTVLSFLAQSARDDAPSSARELLQCAPRSCALPAETLHRHRWYEALPEELPIWMDAGRLELRRERLRRGMANSGVVLVDLGVSVIPAGELNASFSRTHNKATSVWERVARILGHLFQTYGSERPHVILDQQGGRSHYAALLAEDFEPARVEIEGETAGRSRYRLTAPDGERAMRITVAERAENLAFTVALASCLAKYARELSMEAFNAWFARLQPGLKPTAGYTTDGRRWLKEAAPALERASIPARILVRSR